MKFQNTKNTEKSIKTKQKPIKQNCAFAENLDQTCLQCLCMLQLPCVSEYTVFSSAL